MPTTLKACCHHRQSLGPPLPSTKKRMRATQWQCHSTKRDTCIEDGEIMSSKTPKVSKMRRRRFLRCLLMEPVVTSKWTKVWVVVIATVVFRKKLARHEAVPRSSPSRETGNEINRGRCISSLLRIPANLIRELWQHQIILVSSSQQVPKRSHVAKNAQWILKRRQCYSKQARQMMMT